MPLVSNPGIILGSKHPHFPGEHNTEYNTDHEDNSLSSYRGRVALQGLCQPNPCQSDLKLGRAMLVADALALKALLGSSTSIIEYPGALKACRSIHRCSSTSSDLLA